MALTGMDKNKLPQQIDLHIRKLEQPIVTVMLTSTQAQRLFNTGFELRMAPDEVVQRALDSFFARTPLPQTEAAQELSKGECHDAC